MQEIHPFMCPALLVLTGVSLFLPHQWSQGPLLRVTQAVQAWSGCVFSGPWTSESSGSHAGCQNASSRLQD